MYSFLKPHFFPFSQKIPWYKYILAHFQQNIFSKKLDKLFPNGRTLKILKSNQELTHKQGVIFFFFFFFLFRRSNVSI